MVSVVCIIDHQACHVFMITIIFIDINNNYYCYRHRPISDFDFGTKIIGEILASE